MTPLAMLVERAGFAPGTPVAVARVVDGAIEEMTSGIWPNGQPVTPTDRFYAASLAKQITGAALALLVRDGRIDPDRPVSNYVGGLPPWSATVTPRHLAHHTSGLPPAGELEARMTGDWTEALVFPKRKYSRYRYYGSVRRIVIADPRRRKFLNCSTRATLLADQRPSAFSKRS